MMGLDGGGAGSMILGEFEHAFKADSEDEMDNEDIGCCTFTGKCTMIGDKL